MNAEGDDDIAEATLHLGISNEQTPLPIGQPNAEPCRQARINTRGVIAKDITKDFSKASSALNTGQLVKDEWFTLFESVGALEIMDPKMDSGYLNPGESLEDDYDILRELLPEEVIGIMDQLLCHEIAWHKGNPLSQTLFTSLYIDKLLWPEPKTLKDAQFFSVPLQDEGYPLLHNVLRGYCLALIKCCGLVHQRIGTEHCYEEEDFVSHLFNRNLLASASELDLLALLDQALEWLNTTSDLSQSVKKSLEYRLNFRRKFLLVVAAKLEDVKTLSASRWEDCANILPTIKESHRCGRVVEDSFSVRIQRKLASTVPPRPIVHLDFDDAIEHLVKLCQDGKDLVRVFDYCGGNSLMNFLWAFQSRDPQPSIYIRALLQSILFADMKVLDRMSVRQLLFDDLAETTLPADILVDRQNQEVELPGDPRFQINQRMDIFVSRAGQSYLDLFRALCQNRSRIRRTLCHTILDWEQLQIDAEDIDAELQSFTKETPIIDHAISPEPIYAFPLSSWAYNLKLRQMEWIIQLGFELDVYQPDELAAMYWYLQYLAQTRLAHLERIRGFVSRRAALAKDSHSSQKSGAVERNGDDIGAYKKTLSFLNCHMLEATAIQGFADALSCLYTALSRLGLLPSGPKPYSTNALRYELRMKPFLHISLPELIPYEQFESLVGQRDESLSSLLSVAQTSLLRSRKDFDLLSKTPAPTSRTTLCADEWKSKIKNVVRACIATGIAISAVEKEVKSDDDLLQKTAADDDDDGRRAQRSRKKSKEKLATGRTLQLDMERGKTYHDWWVVPSIKKRI
ncbi:MAG: hypothetical protein M1837_001310 [Sclerophora amabilis]|nr:MAG: hypothetical protein M1837_001310 [Sclerophora amabilis]